MTFITRVKRVHRTASACPMFRKKKGGGGGGMETATVVNVSPVMAQYCTRCAYVCLYMCAFMYIHAYTHISHKRAHTHTYTHKRDALTHTRARARTHTHTHTKERESINSNRPPGRPSVWREVRSSVRKQKEKQTTKLSQNEVSVSGC